MHLPQHTCSYYCVGTTHAVRVLTITSDVEASWTIARALAQRYYGEYVVVDLLPARAAVAGSPALLLYKSKKLGIGEQDQAAPCF